MFLGITPRVKPILAWIAKLFRELAGANQCLHPDLLMFGFPDIVGTAPVFEFGLFFVSLNSYCSEIKISSYI